MAGLLRKLKNSEQMANDSLQEPTTEETLQELLAGFDEDQLKFVAARIHCKSDVEAARVLGVKRGAVYNWGNKQDINKAVRLSQMRSLEISRERLNRLSEKAIGVLDDEMSNKRNKLQAAIQVLDRTGFGATQTVKNENSGTTEIIVKYDTDE